MKERTSRTAMLIGEDKLLRLEGAAVAVFGVGGVGSYVVEALARCGVGRLTVIDADRVSESNINRQLIADYSTLGKLKTEAARERIALVNPECTVAEIPLFVTPENLSEIPLGEFDYVVDAIDTVSAKLAIIKKCKELGVPVISSMGTGNKLNPEELKVADIYKTSVCPLARVMRRELKALGIKSLKVVYSEEEPKRAITPASEGSRVPPASIAFVPSTAGLIIASEVVKDVINRVKDEKK